MSRLNSNVQFLTTKRIFILSLIVALLTIIGVWLFGVGKHRSLFENTLLSTSILSIAFFLFLSINLYRGIKLKENMGRITDKIKLDKLPDISSSEVPSGIPELGDDIGGILLGIVAWILFSILLIIFIWFFTAIAWAMILVFAAMLYWIFYRALRLAFKKSKLCKGDLKRSLTYSLYYTVLYNFWIYGIILCGHYLR